MAPRVLVVDDEERMRDLLALHLEPVFDVDTAASGDEALKRLSATPYDLVILDILMPGRDGRDVCEEIRSRFEVPVLMLTALSGVEEKLEAFSVGADDYMTKPFDARELIARAQALLRRSGRKATDDDLTDHREEDSLPQPLRFFPKVASGGVLRDDSDRSTLFQSPSAGLMIDPVRRTVMRNGEPVRLTPMEFDLLYHLALHPERVFSREELLSDVWQDEGYVETRTVDSHVKTLREKLGRGGWGKAIATVWGSGYKFDPAEMPGRHQTFS